MLTDTADEVAFGPELAAPQLSFDAGHAGQHLTRGNALDGAHDLGRAVSRHRLHQKVHMISIGAYFYKDDLVAQGNLQTYLTQYLIYVGIEHHPPVLGGTDQVIQQSGDTAIRIHYGS